jgi:hypothetical protein
MTSHLGRCNAQLQLLIIRLGACLPPGTHAATHVTTNAPCFCLDCLGSSSGVASLTAQALTECAPPCAALQVSGRAQESLESAKQSSQEAWDHTKAASQETASQVGTASHVFDGRILTPHPTHILPVPLTPYHSQVRLTNKESFVGNHHSCTAWPGPSWGLPAVHTASVVRRSLAKTMASFPLRH